MILNLTDNFKSEIKFEISKFPDGQQSLNITKPQYITNTSAATDTFQIRSRLNSFADLELILCATQALRNKGVKNIELYVPYFLGGRSDRLFVEGGVNYLKQIITPIINSQGYSNVSVLDPHSDVLEALITNFSKTNNFRLVKFALEKIDNKDGAQSRIALVSPDAGAFKKIYDVATHFGIEKIITATKVRDMKTGNILHTDVPGIDQHTKIKYVIVDDICDGGRTFIEIAKTIHNVRPTAKIYLVVTHGIFSAGYDELNKYFSGIFTTNSIKNIGLFTEEDIDGNFYPTGITQLNVY
jgi:ribose-phosphate pyrophosphokinase